MKSGHRPSALNARETSLHLNSECISKRSGCLYPNNGVLVEAAFRGAWWRNTIILDARCHMKEEIG